MRVCSVKHGVLDHHLDHVLVEHRAVRRDIHIALANATLPKWAKHWGEFVEVGLAMCGALLSLRVCCPVQIVGDALFWRNRYFLRRVRRALWADALHTVMDDYTLEEAWRVLWDLRTEAESKAQSEVVARVDRYLSSRDGEAYPSKPHRPSEPHEPSKVPLWLEALG